MSNDETARAIIESVNSWIENRDRIVRARKLHEEASFFAANQGTHMAFIRQLEAHSNMIAGALPLMNPRQIEAFRELVSSWASKIERLEQKNV